MSKFTYSLLIIVLLLYGGSSLIHAKDQIFYLGKEGFLIEFDTEQTLEIGKNYLGEMPFAITEYNNKIYSTDFAKDTVYEYDINSKSVKKENIDFLQGASLQDIQIYEPPNHEIPKSVLRKIIEPKFGDRRYKQKQLEKQTKSPIVLELPIHKHNKKLGLSALTSDAKNIYVISTLQERVLVLNKQTLKFSHSYYVGQRPTALGISPNEKYLAVASGALNKLFIINTISQDKVLELDVSHAPTQIIWLDNNNLALLNRGDHSVSIVNTSSQSITRDIHIPVYINGMTLNEAEGLLYVLSGNDFKLITINLKDNYKYTTTEIPEGMYYPDGILSLGNNQLLISSHRDRKLLLLDLANAENNKKVQANFSPLRLLKIKDSQFTNIIDLPVAKKKKPTSSTLEFKSKELTPSIPETELDNVPSSPKHRPSGQYTQEEIREKLKQRKKKTINKKAKDTLEFKNL